MSQTVTFELLAQEWLELQSRKLGVVTIANARWILEKFVYPPTRLAAYQPDQGAGSAGGAEEDRGARDE